MIIGRVLYVVGMLSAPASAQLAVYMPEGTATVDGSIADWSGAAWRTGTLQMGYYTGANINSSNEDVVIANTRWATRWSPNPSPDQPGHVYAVMQVDDTNHQFLDSFTEWNATDRVEWYVHGVGPVENPYYSNLQGAQQYVMSPMASDPSTPWIEMGYFKGSPESMGLDIQRAVNVTGDTITYEISIPVYDVFGGLSGATTVVTDMQPGITIGFDTIVGSRITPYPGSTDPANYYMLDETGIPSSTKHKADGSSSNMQNFTLAAPGDANLDGKVDGADFLVWQNNFGTASGATWSTGDFNGDGKVDGADFLLWQNNFGADYTSTSASVSAAVPEPATLTLLSLGALGLIRRRRSA
jgi:hypothetical protein